MNSYVPNYVSNNLKWYERDSLSTWYDDLKNKAAVKKEF